MGKMDRSTTAIVNNSNGFCMLDLCLVLQDKVMTERVRELGKVTLMQDDKVSILLFAHLALH